ncbi:hypothetical protein JTB14_020298 [Gonioctena quinquepunctata]|nr:hypothetical protein JTB14_020298 [Gonioctena quinquepunctata]
MHLKLTEKCARQFTIPNAKLTRPLNNKNNRSVFFEKAENELVDHLLALEENMFGMTVRVVGKLAFKIANKNDHTNICNQEKRMAGKKWYNGFMGRHKELSLRQPELTSLAKAEDFNKSTVATFFPF